MKSATFFEILRLLKDLQFEEIDDIVKMLSRLLEYRYNYVYISGPISAPTEEQVDKNVDVAVRFSHQLMDAGFIVVCPHLSVYSDRIIHRPYEEWMIQDFALIRRCDSLIRIAPSPGANREWDFAVSAGIPTFTNMEDLINFRKTNSR